MFDEFYIIFPHKDIERKETNYFNSYSSKLCFSGLVKVCKNNFFNLRSTLHGQIPEIPKNICHKVTALQCQFVKNKVNSL